MSALVGLSLSFPTELHEDFVGQDYVSKFARTGVEAIHEFSSHGYLDADASVAENLKAASATCHPSRRLPNIILLHDESSFDITAAPGIKVPDGLSRSFPIAGWQSAQTSGGGHWRTKLVRGIQRTDRAFSPLLWAVRDIGNQDRHRPCQSWTATLIEPLRLSDFQPVSILRRFSGLACFPDKCWY